MQISFPYSRVTAALAALVLIACGGGDKPAQAPAASAAGSGSELTAFQIENGIGPVTEAVTLGSLDEEMAEAGEKVFEAKCTACHKMDERYVGPPLGGVTEHRTAAYLMNMMLNPDGMYAKHPEARKLLAEYMTQMPNLGLTQEEARAIVEYLRTQPPSAAAK